VSFSDEQPKPGPSWVEEIAPDIKPREYQERAIEAIVAGFENHDRGQVIMACGTGKTLVAIWAAQRLAAQRILVTAPSIPLLAQLITEWGKHWCEPIFVVVCHDETIGAADPNAVKAVDTDPATIGKNMVGLDRYVVFCTYHSAPRVADAMRDFNLSSFDLVIADEAHRCVGVRGRLFSAVIEEDEIPAQRRLFMTATPRIATAAARTRADKRADELVSMDDERHFGSVIFEYPFSRAIEDGFLCKYQVVIVLVDDQETKRLAEIRAVQAEDALDLSLIAAQVALSKAHRKYGVKSVISFHGRVRKARYFAALFPGIRLQDGAADNELVEAECIHARIPSIKRQEAMEKLRDDHLDMCLVSNARCLAEGVDVPGLDAVMFADPKQSIVDIVQAVGRVLRIYPDKSIGSVIVPVYVTSTSDPDQEFKRGGYQAVWNVIKAMRAHDDNLTADLDRMRRQSVREETTSITLPTQIIVEASKTITKGFIQRFQSVVVEQTVASLHQWLGLLDRFVEREGHACVPSLHVEPDGARLGNWVGMTRAKHSRGLLDRAVAAKLEALPGWIWNTADEAWTRGYEALNRYVERNPPGDRMVLPSGYVDDVGYKLAAWVAEQRTKYRINQPSRRLSLEQIERLESVPGWAWRRQDADWDDGYGRAQAFVAEHGTLRVPKGQLERGGFNLAQWLQVQRRARKRGEMTEDRQARLDALPGWSWSGRFRPVPVDELAALKRARESESG
jgi:superfamily II DNA or RNA helicase